MPWADFDDQELSIMHALFDTLIPADDYPGGWDGGVSRYLEVGFQSHLAFCVAQYKEHLRILGAEFVAAESQGRIERINELNSDFVSLAASHAAEGYYAEPGPGWQMIGFEVTA